LDGAITANGLPGVAQWSGGGAGGSLWLIVGTLSGRGLIAATGGAGDPPYGGGGGGGRIAVQYGTNAFQGTISARGGSGAVYGGAGTIWSRTNASIYSQLVVDNGGAIGASTPISNLESSDLRVVAGARVVFSSTQQSMRSLLIG